jgi:hypothetical protein
MAAEFNQGSGSESNLFDKLIHGDGSRRRLGGGEVILAVFLSAQIKYLAADCHSIFS